MLAHFSVESRLLTLDGRDNLARVSTRAKLEVPDTLPCASRQTAVGDGNIH